MKRIIALLMVSLFMVAVIVAMSVPAFAKRCGGEPQGEGLTCTSTGKPTVVTKAGTAPPGQNR